MYKTDFVCTYKEFEKIEDDEVNADMMYRAQYLQVFGLIHYDTEAINASLKMIKSKVVELPELRALVLKHPYHSKISLSQKEDDALDMLLVCMFSYPTMDVFHLCLIDAFKTGKISQTNSEKLLIAYLSMSS